MELLIKHFIRGLLGNIVLSVKNDFENIKKLKSLF